MAKQALSVSQVLSQKLETFELSEEWQQFIGKPEACGTWLIWGKSGNGKSTFVMKLAKALCEFGVVLYDSLEEGTGLTLVNTMKRLGMMEVNGRLRIINESMEELGERLEKKRSPRIVIIDSFQYARISYIDYIAFKERFPNHLLIFVSHARGNNPAGDDAVSVMYDASLKIWVEGYRAFSKGRFIGSRGEYDIWKEQAEVYWGK